MYLGTYKIFINALVYVHLVNSNNQDAEIMGEILSKVLKLSSSYIDPFGLDEFSRIV